MTTRAWRGAPIDEADDLLALSEADWFEVELVLDRAVAFEDADAFGDLLPMMGAGLEADELLVRGLAVPEPPVIVKYVEKMGFNALPLKINRIAYC